MIKLSPGMAHPANVSIPSITVDAAWRITDPEL
jgi:hypothetical protein